MVLYAGGDDNSCSVQYTAGLGMHYSGWLCVIVVCQGTSGWNVSVCCYST